MFLNSINTWPINSTSNMLLVNLPIMLGCINIVFTSQDDKDLVHEFVNSDGLSALISVGQDADQNYQNYILRGLKN